MPNDTLRLTTGARERLSRLKLDGTPEMTPLRTFVVPFAIEGALVIEATDAETAKYLADNKPRHVFDENGVLTVFDAEPAEATQ